MKSLLCGLLLAFNAYACDIKKIKIYTLSYPWIIETNYDHSEVPIFCGMCTKHAEFVYVISFDEIYATCQEHYCFDKFMQIKLANI